MAHARAFAIVTLATASVAITVGLSGLATRTARAVVLSTLASAIVFVQTPLAAVVHLAPLHLDDWLLAAAAGIPPAALCVLLRSHFSGAGKEAPFAAHGVAGAGPRRLVDGAAARSN